MAVGLQRRPGGGLGTGEGQVMKRLYLPLDKHRDLALVVALFAAFRLMWLMAYPPDSLML